MAKTIGQLTQATTISNADEFVIEQSGLTKRVAASVVRGGLVNADVDAAAAIAFSKLAALDSANILVGNASNVATKVAVTGDVTISNAGVTAIGSAKVLTAMVNNAAITPSKLSQPLTLATAQNTTSGTSIDFIGIPSWAKRITVMLDGVSTNGSSLIQVQIGSGSVTTSGYASTGTTSGATIGSTSGFITVYSGAATYALHGTMQIYLMTGSTYVASSVIAIRNSGSAFNVTMATGSASLSGALDRVRLTTANGTDTFDAGSVNIMYEG